MVLFIIKNSLTKEKTGITNYLKPGDKVLLIQDGVLVLNTNSSKELDEIRKKNTEVFALKEDLKLRGIKNNANANLIDYSGFVELLEKEKVFS